MNISLCEHKSGPMLQAVKQSLTRMSETSGFGQFFIVSGVLKKCLAPSQNSNAWPPNIHIWTTLSLFSRYVSTDGSKRRYHSSRVSVVVAGRDSCWFFIYWCSEDLNEEFSSSQNLFLRRTPTSQDHFALQHLLWPDYLHVEISWSWLVAETNTKFARHIACCAWSAVKWITRQV